MKKFINNDDMKQANSLDVFYLIRELRSTTRKQIESITGLSWGAVFNIIDRLIESGFIIEHKPAESTGPGRTPLFLEVNGDYHYMIGLDINMTGIHAELINLKNESLKQWSCEADYSNKKALLNCIFNLTEQILEEVKNYHIIGIGIAMQGVVDVKNGSSIYLPQCANWENVPLADLMEKRFNIPTYLEHDPNCILFAETNKMDFRNVILLRIDKSIGMALMIDGKIFKGDGMLEIGHTTVIPNGAICSCGNLGCLEAYASENGIAKLANASFQNVVDKAKCGDVSSLKLFDDMAMYLGISIGNATNIFNSDHIILCGEMMSYKDLFLDKTSEWVEKTSFQKKPNLRNISVIKAENAAYGAALIAIKKSIQTITI